MRRRTMLVVVLLIAAAARLAWITSPPFDFAVSRQAYVALRARLIYLDNAPNLPAWKQSVLTEVRPEVPQLEPPVIEHVAAFSYRLVGSEQLWVPRVLSVLFWLFGGIVVYVLASRLGGQSVRVTALSLYLFLPFGIFASRSFQPDPLMVALTLASLYFVIRFHERPTGARLSPAILFAATAILVKPPVPFFFVAGAFLALAVAKSGWRRGILAWPTATFVTASLAPAALYYLVYLRGQAGGYSQPSLVADPSFWRGWMSMIGTVIVYPMNGLEGRRLSGFILLGVDLLVAALMLLGFRATRRRDGRALLLGLWIGYVAFALMFAPKASTHAYYSLPLVPIIALSVAPLAERLVAFFGRARPIIRVLVLAVGCSVLTFVGWQVVQGLADERYAKSAQTYQEIGALTQHTSHGMHIDEYFQSPLLYYAWIASATLAYPGQAIPRGYIAERLGEVARNGGRPKFLIVTDLHAIDEQPELSRFVGGLDVLARTQKYAIFELPKDKPLNG